MPARQQRPASGKKGSSQATIGSSYLHDDNNGKVEKSLTFTVSNVGADGHVMADGLELIKK